MIGPLRPVALVVVAVLAAGCAIAPSPSGPPSEAPHASPSIGSPAPGDTLSGEPPDGWQRVRLDDAIGAATFSDIVAGPNGFLAAGGGGPIGKTAIILQTIDGRDWSREAIDGSFAAPSALLTVGARVFAVGGNQTDRCAHPAALATWAREAAGTWQEAPFDPVLCAGPGNATLLEFDSHVVLLGAGAGDVPFYLTSVDGLRWAAAGRDPFGDVYPHAVVAHGPDLWLFGTAPDGQPVVVHRSAGGPFEAMGAVPGLGADASILDAVWFDDGPLAIVAAHGAAGLLERDGVGPWIISSAEGLPADHVSRIDVIGDHLIALGGTEQAVPEAWTSADGSVWTPVTLPHAGREGTVINSVAVIGGTAVLVGQVPSPDGTGAIGAIWTGPADLLAP
jgi:hypothetical protein